MYKTCVQLRKCVLTGEIVLKDQEHRYLSSAQPKNSPPSGIAKISSIPPRSNQNASEPKAKANTRKDQPVIRLGGNACKVGQRTTPQDLSRRTPARQPGTISMPSQGTSISDPSFHASSGLKHFHEVIGLLATTRRDRGSPAFEVQRQLELQRDMLIDERYAKITLSHYPIPHSMLSRTVLECLEEGVKLGILTQKTNPPGGSRLIPLTFYAVKKMV